MSKKLNIVLIIILLCLLCYIGIDKLFNKKEPVVETIIQNREITETDKLEYYSYSELIDFEDSNEDDSFTVHKTIYLFDSGDYYYDYAEYGDTCGVWSIGTYEKKDNKLILTEAKVGGCDDCYYTLNTKIYTFDIVGNNLVSDENETLEKSKANYVPIIDIDSLGNFNNCDKEIK